MLTKLSISHFALIDFLEIDFQEGLNVLSGETGAGKSILMQALSLLLGARAQSDLIRSGEESCEVSACLQTGSHPILNHKLKSLGLKQTAFCILKRVIYRQGKSKVWVNDTLASVSFLQEIAPFWIQLLSQHANQDLLKDEAPLELLDQFAEVFEIKKQYQEQFVQVESLEKDLNELKISIENIKQKEDLYRFQLEEIENANIQVAEDESLFEQIKLLQNSASVVGQLNDFLNIFEYDAQSVIAQLKRSSVLLNRLKPLPSSLDSLHEDLALLGQKTEDISFQIQKTLSSLNCEPSELKAMEARDELLYKLKKKYGSTLEEVLSYSLKIKEKLNLLEDSGLLVEELSLKRDLAAKELLRLAKLLSEKRYESAPFFSKALEKGLTELKMPKAKFELKLNSSFENLKFQGAENLKFLFSANAGEELKPLELVASGGELSRLTLTIQTILKKQEFPILYVFDEVDTGIGGAVTQAVGKKIKKISKTDQVVCITHLPQIAIYADAHFQIEKLEKSGRTQTQIRLLKQIEKVDEIARMLAGDEKSELAKKHAEELLASVTE